jgi:hypothetical protein
MIVHCIRPGWVAKYRPACVACALAALCLGQPLQAGAEPPAPIIVDTAEALEAALTETNGGRRIFVVRGTYEIANPLVVPDGARLEGEGVMLGHKRPTGFDPDTVTRIVAADGFSGDLLTLGDGVRLSGLVIEYAGGSAGNAVTVASRTAGDAVSATILECEVINPNPSGVAMQGPTGDAVLVFSRNPNLGADPPPHEGAELDLRVHRSIIRAPGGGAAVFTINFAARSLIRVSLVQNRIEGPLRVTGGVSRPDGVTGTTTFIRSERNLYSAANPADPGPGWQIYGGSTTPIGLVTPPASSNVVHVNSLDDRIEHFAHAVLAAAGVTFFANQNPSSDNSVDLRLQGLTLQTPDTADAADLVLHAARSGVGLGEAEFSPGDGNTLRVLVRNASGSGDRQNAYGIVHGPVLPENSGNGNRLEFVGSETAFGNSNRQIRPGPSTEFFTGGGGN